MERTLDYRECPSCADDRVFDLLPKGDEVDTTLDLVFDRSRSAEFTPFGLAAFLSPRFAICPRCALIFVRTRSTPEAAKDYYARLFHVIETPLPYATLPIPERFVDRKGRIARDLIATLAEHGVLSGVESVLYVRCNAGEGPRVLRDEHGLTEVYALEVLPSLMRHAREVLGLANIEPLHVPEFENPFARKRFDLILCDEAFGHAHDPRRVAATLRSLLAEGGALVCFNEKDHAQILRSGKLFPHGMNFFHKQLYTRRSLRLFLEDRGFEVGELPHPFLGKPTSIKNTKILYVARSHAGVTPSYPSDEVDELARTFRRWWRAHRWRRRGRRLRSVFPQRSRGAELGGEARR